MSSIMGQIVTAMVTDENDTEFLVQKDGTTMHLLKDDTNGQLTNGSMVKGFVYENEDHDLSLSTTIPRAGIDQYAFGNVVKVRRDLGVFVDIGLPDKDVAVSLDDLPEMKSLWPKAGDRLMVGLKIDAKDRIWGDVADEEMFREIAKKPDDSLKNKNMKFTVIRLKMIGTFVITDDDYLGFIHPSERFNEPRLGQVLEGRVIGIRTDGTINLSIKPRAYEAIGDDAAMLVAALTHNDDQSLPFTDKSDPEDIKEYFGISKGQFKRAVGHLLKGRYVKQEDGKLILIKMPEELENNADESIDDIENQ
ncbi:CvfB family protein [Dellaglioa carnosa]|uniref:S1-like domain-containing RNA-binding protein n=1 Tax=Dellaglioa carnosa TaxID=2995136 RepID=A0ABT4JKK6_9LACO|nr:S1-like domain-containing RNA-binding protein [Dellaglioa carnosa]MCZ2490906.1 S1-like domain-containing RNA-binding protein [Dellaglioa carnosa]MCZ2493984.1 S1-like domain-containing RNA-binding protein [Dellaglioa carnosa]MDK1730848.1 S1-like domain-containing RNA-binding protein [Dellaglioa carnosa]